MVFWAVMCRTISRPGAAGSSILVITVRLGNQWRLQEVTAPGQEVEPSWTWAIMNWTGSGKYFRPLQYSTVNTTKCFILKSFKCHLTYLLLIYPFIYAAQTTPISTRKSNWILDPPSFQVLDETTRFFRLQKYSNPIRHFFQIFCANWDLHFNWK